MKRLHVHVSVEDIAQSIRFYSTLFATEPANERCVRSLIGEALAAGQLTGPDGGLTTWQLRSAAAGNVRPDEKDHAAGLITA